MFTKAQTSQEGIYYYHTDHLGTPIMLTDANQQVAWDATYDPFGKATVTTASVTNNLRFPGQYYDSETGLHYNMARYYWPEVGRYISPDPAGLNGNYSMGENKTTQYNIYTYAFNDPINKTDSTGLWTNPTGGEIRGCDCCGCGYFGAPRKNDYGEHYPHEGVDILGKRCCPVSVTFTNGSGRGLGLIASAPKLPRDEGPQPKPGTMPVKAIIGGTLTETKSKMGVWIEGLVEGTKYKILEYHIQSLYTKKEVKEGEYIGVIVGGRCEAGKEWEPHVHVEVRDEKGFLYDPTPIINNRAPWKLPYL